jgi:hypothetical protein
VAIFHCNSSIIKRSSGSSSVASAAYRSAENILDERTGLIHTYARKKGVLHTEIITPENSPDWANDRSKLWNAVEAAEKRKDSQLAREIMVALPNELNEQQRLQLVRNYITEQFVNKGMIADIAIHAPNKRGDDRNYHAHILLTMRQITSEGFGNKVRAWNAKANLYQWREQWQHHTNQMLKQAGFECQIDGRSHANKGLDKEPLLHLGVHATALERKGIATELGNENRAIEYRNAQREQLRHELAEVNREINELPLEKSEPILSSTVEADDNDSKQTTLIDAQSQQEIQEPSQQSATPAINDIPLSDENTLDVELDNSIEATKIHNDVALNQAVTSQETTVGQSIEERKKALEQTAEVFKAQQEELQRQIENAADEKTKNRLQLQAQLDSANFTKNYNKELVAILTKDDQQKNAKAISVLKHKTRKAEQDYKKQAAEWSARAVRDDDYQPLDQRSADKIDKMKKAEQRQWARFEVKAKTKGWSLDRIEKERQHLREEMDLELGDYFGLDLDYDLEMDL